MPGRVAIYEKMKELELRRLAGEDVGPVADSGVEVHREIVKGLVWKKPEQVMTAQKVSKDEVVMYYQ